MTKSVMSPRSSAPSGAREPRPFLFLEPRRPAVSGQPTFAAADVALLDAIAAPTVPSLVRSLVNFTIALQNRRGLEHGNAQPIQLSVLNRRRRSARAWILAILAGKTDAGTLHAVATQWLPTLCGTGPDLARCLPPAGKIIEFVRGGLTATIFAEANDNLVPQARALHALESLLAEHFGAVRAAARTPQSIRV
ncbi:MAG: hypothetical protein KDE27_03920 [Planctomycetes bacterium]|nr:hypothetical protein [Planctomycetota bacterium]